MQVIKTDPGEASATTYQVIPVFLISMSNTVGYTGNDLSSLLPVFLKATFTSSRHHLHLIISLPPSSARG